MGQVNATLPRWAVFKKNPQAISNEYGYYSGPSEVRKGICSIHLASNALDSVSEMRYLYLVIT